MKTPVNMLSLIFIFLGQALLCEAAILQCDFESPCDDFDLDYNWGRTNGLKPHSIDHDHTFNNKSGHYLFYNPQSLPSFYEIYAEISTIDWIQPSTDGAVCFRMWYYTPRLSLPFSIQIVQGDDEKLSRIIESISGKDPSINDWTLINVTLPNEKMKIFIRLNVSTIPLAFDDLSVDYCDEPPPSPPKILFACDFESSCTNDFIYLPDYTYQWSIMEANDAVKIESGAPSVDFTFGNQSGHYAILPNSKIIQKGQVGYFALQTIFNITDDESFCLNFQYYGYGRSYAGNLNVYAWLSDQPEGIQKLWPSPTPNQYSYTSNNWTWSIVNLPVGYYSFLFRVDNSDSYPRSFALDNISVTSCDYPPSTFFDNGGLLSFSCDFDNLTMCEMENGYASIKPTYNFSVVTGDTLPNQELGPDRDHTSNSTSGGFIYWNRELPYGWGDSGYIHPSKSIAVNWEMCIRFAYYVKSSKNNKNGTMLSVTAGGCMGTFLWSRSLDDSQGWQVVVLAPPNVVCMESLAFSVNQQQLVPISVAFDDIEIEQCNILFPTTTTSTTTTTTTTTTTITRTTTQMITTSSSPTTATTLTSTTASTLPKTTAMPSIARRLLSFNIFALILICLLIIV